MIVSRSPLHLLDEIVQATTWLEPDMPDAEKSFTVFFRAAAAGTLFLSCLARCWCRPIYTVYQQQVEPRLNPPEKEKNSYKWVYLAYRTLYVLLLLCVAYSDLIIISFLCSFVAHTREVGKKSSFHRRHQASSNMSNTILRRCQKPILSRKLSICSLGVPTGEV